MVDKDNINPKIIANCIEELVELQIQSKPFIDIEYKQNQKLRVITCLYIYDFAYLIFYLNPYIRFQEHRIKNLIDRCYKHFLENFTKKYQETVLINEIIVNPQEQIDIIESAHECFINYEITTTTPIHKLFPFLYDYRIPKYLDAIKEGVINYDNNIFIPFNRVHQLFTEQVLGEFDAEFSTKFYLMIDGRTQLMIVKMINEFI